MCPPGSLSNDGHIAKAWLRHGMAFSGVFVGCDLVLTDLVQWAGNSPGATPSVSEMCGQENGWKAMAFMARYDRTDGITTSCSHSETSDEDCCLRP